MTRRRCWPPSARGTEAISGSGGTGLTVASLLAKARRTLRATSAATPDLDARLIVADSLGLSSAGLILQSGTPVPPAAAALAEARILRRATGEPVHRILGHRAFYAHEFALSPETLEPRPDTEVLVDLCRAPIETVISEKGTCLLADVGTGSGAIGISLLALFPPLTVVATDLAPGALATARANAASAGVASRFHAVACDYLSAVAGPLDLVVSNPPYIPTGEIASLSREVRDFDPRVALDGGADGLDAYRILASEMERTLAVPGHVLVEIGQGQESDVCEIFMRKGLVIAASATDLSNITRALWFRRYS